MVGYAATGIIFAVLESPKSFTGTRHVRSCLIIILNIYRRYFQHAHFIPIVGVGKRGEY